jgi:hypothetical protein
MRAKIDLLLNSWISKKLMVFAVACFGLFSGALASEEWVNIAMVYLGTQGAIDAIQQLRSKQID